MKRSGFATIVENKPGERLIERDKKQLELIERQKQEIIKNLDAQIEKLKEDKKNAEKVFFEDYKLRIEKIDAREAKVVQLEKEIDERVRELDRDRVSFENVIREFHKDKESTVAKLAGQTLENKAILREIVNEKENIQALVRRNEQIIENVKAEYERLAIEKNKAAAFIQEADTKLKALKEKEDEINAKAAESLERLNAAIKLEEFNKQVFFDIQNERKALAKSVEGYEHKIEETQKVILIQEKMIREADAKLKQINLETEKNAADMTALKAKEKLLNEKERVLNEREKNVKILEKKLTEKES